MQDNLSLTHFRPILRLYILENVKNQRFSELLKFKVCGEGPYVGKGKTKFRYRFNNHKSKHRVFRRGNRKVTEKLFHAHYCLDGHTGIEDWDFVIFDQCKTHAQLKERETFWQHRLKKFCPICLKEKKEYLY